MKLYRPSIEKIKTMHFIASAIVLAYLISSLWQIVESGLLVNAKVLESADYKEITKEINRNIKELVTIVVMYFFGREVGKKQANEME